MVVWHVHRHVSIYQTPACWQCISHYRTDPVCSIFMFSCYFTHTVNVFIWSLQMFWGNMSLFLYSKASITFIFPISPFTSPSNTMNVPFWGGLEETHPNMLVLKLVPITYPFSAADRWLLKTAWSCDLCMYSSPCIFLMILFMFHACAIADWQNSVIFFP